MGSDRVPLPLRVGFLLLFCSPLCLVASFCFVFVFMPKSALHLVHEGKTKEKGGKGRGGGRGWSHIDER